MRSLFITSLLLGTLYVQAQQLPFSQKNVTLPQLDYSACAWGDYDHDGDLDLALTGANGNNPLTSVFRNDNGNFTDIQAGMLALHDGSVEWGDYDSDGDLDLLVTGIENSGDSHTIIYKNTLGTFTNSGISLPGIMDGQACWGDYDNDGNLDILLAGSSMARVYRNNGNGEFTNINAPLPNVESAMCCWNDYNNDGQSDIMVCGNTGGGMISTLFKNNHGVFTEVTIADEPFTGLYGGQVKWADMDKDGDQDLVLGGMDLYIDGYLIIYRNDGNDHFTKFDQSTVKLLYPSFDLGDYDGDGLPDIALIGRLGGCGGNALTLLVQNLGSMNFFEVSTLLPGYKQGGVTWGDYNNDGYTDLLFTGTDAFEVPKTGLYLNNLGDTTLFTQNNPPSPPQGLDVTMEPDKAIVRWHGSADAQTPKDAISYNISIGTQPGLHDVLSPLAVISNGFRTVTAPGNASSDTNWIIRGIPSGSYYLRVQAIDNGFMPGAFSEPYLFTFSPVGITSHESATFTVSPNPCHERITICEGSSVIPDSRIRIISETGRNFFEGVNPEAIDVSSWPAGMYLVQKTDGRATTSAKFIKN